MVSGASRRSRRLRSSSAPSTSRLTLREGPFAPPRPVSPSFSSACFTLWTVPSQASFRDLGRGVGGRPIPVLVKLARVRFYRKTLGALQRRWPATPPTKPPTPGQIARSFGPQPLSPRYVCCPSTGGNTREAAKTLGLAVGCSRLFPAVPGTGDRKRTAGTALRSFLRPIRTFDVDPRARHTFAFSQSAATVMPRPAATLTIVSKRTLNSPRSIAP
jgi:hypothetical protein